LSGVPCLVILCLALSVAEPVSARTLTVDASGDADFTSIQSAVNAASSGDTILVGPGRYQERISIVGLDVYLISTHGPVATTIDGGGTGPVIHCVSMSESSSIEGFTITGGVTMPPLVGGGIYLAAQASPLIRNNIITGNEAFATGGAASAPPAGQARNAPGRPLLCDLDRPAYYGSGGGIFAYLECRPRVIDNLIKDNVARGYGGGVVFFDHADGVLEGNRIYHNEAGRAGGGVVVDCAAIPTVEHNIIAFNEAPSGAAIFVDRIDTDPVIRRNTLYMNSSTQGADGIECGPLCGPEIYGNLIGVLEAGGFVCDPESHPTISCNIVWIPGTQGETGSEFGGNCFPGGMSYLDWGNAVREVTFCGAPAGDFRTCGEVNLNDCGPVGAADDFCDPLGCGTIKGSWGVLKAIYRNP
jgi:hypothetical protein